LDKERVFGPFPFPFRDDSQVSRLGRIGSSPPQEVGNRRDQRDAKGAVPAPPARSFRREDAIRIRAFGSQFAKGLGTLNLSVQATNLKCGYTYANRAGYEGVPLYSPATKGILQKSEPGKPMGTLSLAYDLNSYLDPITCANKGYMLTRATILLRVTVTNMAGLKTETSAVTLTM
jgi:hypothetical protein